MGGIACVGEVVVQQMGEGEGREKHGQSAQDVQNSHIPSTYEQCADFFTVAVRIVEQTGGINRNYVPAGDPSSCW